MKYFVYIILLLLSIAFAEEGMPGIIEMSAEDLAEISDGQNTVTLLELVDSGIILSLEDLVSAALPVNGSDNPIVATSLELTRGGHSGNTPYYTINGNKDITIHGYDKQRLYANAVTDWSIEASYTLPVSNVGYLTYGGTTLCDVLALESGTDYSEFITNVTINGFSTSYEYRLELNNGHVTLWAKLPGESPSVPEPKTSLCLLIASLATLYKKRPN